MSEDTNLSAAIQHLKAFRATFEEGAPVDEESGLTADDLDMAIKAMEAAGKTVAIPYLDLSQPGGWKGLADTIKPR